MDGCDRKMTWDELAEENAKLKEEISLLKKELKAIADGMKMPASFASWILKGRPGR